MKKYVIPSLIIVLALGGCTKLQGKNAGETDANTKTVNEKIVQEVGKNKENTTTDKSEENKSNNETTENSTSSKVSSDAKGNVNNETAKSESNDASNSVEAKVMSDSEKAVEIVIKDLGAVKINNSTYSTKSTGDVFIRYEAIDEKGRHIVSVRNSKTSEIINWYFVDIKTGKFEIGN